MIQLALSWPTFLAPQWAWLALLAIPIILLYVLRQRRPNSPVSSTLLWSKALSDMRASTPWQRLRKNLQLLLQLLLLAAIVLTLMRPVMQARASQAMASVIVIDATASMQTLDGADEGQPLLSRLDRAKEETNTLINSMRPGDRINIIVDGGGMAQTSTGFLNSKQELLAFVNALKPSDSTSDLSESLLLAATSLRAIGASGPEPADKKEIKAGKIFLMSDGAGVALPGIFRDLPLHYTRIGRSSDNVGITRLAVQPMKDPKTYEVFVEVLNASDQDREVTVGLSLGAAGNLVDARKTKVPAAIVANGMRTPSQGSVTFEKVISDPGPFIVTLENKSDILDADNTAYGILAPPQKIRVALVTQGNTHLDRLLEDFLKTPGHVGELAVQVLPLSAYRSDLGADLVIFAGVAPPDDKLPRSDIFFIRPPASVAGFTVRGAVPNPPALRWMREAPELASVSVGEIKVFSGAQIDRDAGATELISTTNGPLMAYRDLGASRRYMLAFSPTAPDSNWWQYSSFLILMENVIGQTKSRHFIGVPQIIAAGTPARLFDVSPEATITTPEGEKSVAKYVKDGVADFPETDKSGIYIVHSGEKNASFAVSVLSSVESDVASRTLGKADDGNVEESRSIAAVNQEIWPWVAAAGLLLLLVEWIVYHRRVG